MNQFILLSALFAAAAAAPEADPQLLYPALVSPHAKTAGLVTHANGAVVPTDTVSVQLARAGHLAHKGLVGHYGYYGYPYAHYLGKREAESKADADPYLLYGHGLYGGYHYKPVITSIGAFTTYSNGAVTPTNTPAVAAATANHLAAKGAVYAAHGYPVYHHLGKREAESDPYYYAHYPFVTSVGGLTTYSNGAVVPTHHANLAATASHIATKAAYPYGFYHHLGKREAEAEADPYFYYAHHYPGVTSSALGGFTTYANGAVVPTDPANLAATAGHLATKAAYPYGYYGYPHVYYG